MIPVAVQVPDETTPLAQRLQSFLTEKGFTAAWNAPLEPQNSPHALFANDTVIRRMQSEDNLYAGIALAMPDDESTDFVRRSVLGTAGLSWVLQDLSAGLWKLVE